MARRPHRRGDGRRTGERRLGADEGGQMMVLAAVLLVIGLIALAGMVSRVNQLGSQTGVESDQAILEEIVPLQDAIDTTLSTLQRRTFTGTVTAATPTAPAFVTVNTASSPDFAFADSDVGLNITGTGISAGAKITVVTSPTVASLSGTATAGSKTLAIFKPGFGLTATTYARAEDALVNALEQLQRIQASHGFWMDYELTCEGGSGGDTDRGMVVAHLSDGTIWVEVQSNVYFPRNTSCASVYG